MLLKTFPILRSLPEKDLAELAGGSTLEKFTRRAIVLVAGEAQKCLCLLFEGRLQGVDFTIDGREVGLYFLEPGGFCGELAVFDHGTQPEHVIALTPVVVVMIPLPRIRVIMQKHTEIMSNLGAKLASRVRQMTAQRSLLALPKIAQRVCCQLWLLVPEQHRETAKEGEIPNPPTHLEIAIMLNASRETVSRVFQQLQAQKIVRRDGNLRLIVTRLKALSDLAEGKSDL